MLSTEEKDLLDDHKKNLGDQLLKKKEAMHAHIEENDKLHVDHAELLE